MSDKEISVEEALDVIAKHRAQQQKTYEDGLKDGEAKGRAAAKEQFDAELTTLATGLSKKLAASKDRVADFVAVHGRSHAGRAFAQVASDIEAIAKLIPQVKAPEAP